MRWWCEPFASLHISLNLKSFAFLQKKCEREYIALQNKTSNTWISESVAACCIDKARSVSSYLLNGLWCWTENTLSSSFTLIKIGFSCAWQKCDLTLMCTLARCLSGWRSECVCVCVKERELVHVCLCVCVVWAEAQSHQKKEPRGKIWCLRATLRLTQMSPCFLSLV